MSEKATPFSNGSEFEYWKFNNCDDCKKYECESTEETKSGCRMAFNLDVASITDGMISKEIAGRIGFDQWIEQEKPKGTFVDLLHQCKEKET